MSKLLELPDFLAKRRQYGVWDDFRGIPASDDIQYIQADIAANTAVAAIVVAAATRRLQVVKAGFVPDGAFASADGSNYDVWTLTDGTNTLATKTVNTNIADNTYTDMGTISFGAIDVGGRLELSMAETGTTCDPPRLVFSIKTFDRDAYPNENWKILNPDHGFGTISDGAKGILAITPSDDTAADNDEIYLCSNKELFLFAADKPIVGEAYVQFTEANTDDANVFFGLVGVASQPTANILVDDGAGPLTSFSGMGFYKVDGGTNWNTVVSLGSTQTKTELTAANALNKTAQTAGGASYQKLRFEWNSVTSTQGRADFFIDDVHVDSRLFTYTSATAMMLVLGAKNGGANAETLNVDYAGADQLR